MKEKLKFRDSYGNCLRKRKGGYKEKDKMRCFPKACPYYEECILKINKLKGGLKKNE